MRGLAAVVSVLIAAGLGCGSPQPDRPTPAPASDAGTDSRIKALASELHTAAIAAEPSTTNVLTALATEAKGRLAGLDNRIKTEKSLLRKIAARLEDRSASRTLATVDIVDALRYTIVIDDAPRGHYVKSAKRILGTLEERGVTVVRVKNYWPRGDNYSGVNVVLRNSDGFQWEIQFHTSDSLAVRNRWYRSYTRLRDAAIELDERRRIFDQMAPPWKLVEIPDGVLEPKSLHATERIILYPRP